MASKEAVKGLSAKQDDRILRAVFQFNDTVLHSTDWKIILSSLVKHGLISEKRQKALETKTQGDAAVAFPALLKRKQSKSLRCGYLLALKESATSVPAHNMLLSTLTEAAGVDMTSLEEEMRVYTTERREEEAKNWQSAYQDSLKKHGSVSVEVTRSIFVGPPEVGKSTLKHLLVHNTPKAIETSTGVLDTPEVVIKRSDMESEQYAMEKGTSDWQLLNSDIMKQSLHACIANEGYEVKDQYLEVLTKEKDQHPTGGITGMQKDDRVVPERFRSRAKKDRSDPIASLDEQHSRLLEEMERKGKGIELKDASFIHLLDTGGQPSFQDVLPLLLDVPCTYIQVFNAAHGLDKPTPITYRPGDSTVVNLANAEIGMDTMLRSFSSMQTMAHKCSNELASFQQEGSQLPQLRIFVVGTFKDELMKEGRLEEATQDIRAFLELLQGKPYYQFIQLDSAGQEFFLLDTISDKEDEKAYVNDLRKSLSSTGYSLKLAVPVVWFICQEITGCIPKKFFRLQHLKAFCLKHQFIDGENTDSQFRALLQLFSLLGFYSFFNLEGVPDEDNFVCTNTGVLLKEVSKLLAVQFTAPRTTEMKKFKMTGILKFTQRLFSELGMSEEMNPHWFLKVLQHLGIAARLSSQGPSEYFIPAVLPQSSAAQNPPASVAPLCLTYNFTEDAVSSSSYMPQGVFCRMAVELIWQGLDIVQYESSRSLLKFQWKEYEEFRAVFLQEFPGYISVIPQVVEEISSPSELHTACNALLSTVEECLTISTMHALGSQFSSDAELAMGFRCHCKGEMLPHLAIPSKAGKGKSLYCSQKSKQTYTNQQRIWFLPVGGVKLKHHPVENICVLEDSEELATGPNAVTAAPMSPWNDSALVFLKRKLMLNVKMHTGLIDILEIAANGFMDRGEAQSVTQLQGDGEQMRQVIEVLRGKGDKQFHIFCDMLRRSNNNVWASELEKAAENFRR